MRYPNKYDHQNYDQWLEALLALHGTNISQIAQVTQVSTLVVNEWLHGVPVLDETEERLEWFFNINHWTFRRIRDWYSMPAELRARIKADEDKKAREWHERENPSLDVLIARMHEAQKHGCRSLG